MCFHIHQVGSSYNCEFYKKKYFISYLPLYSYLEPIIREFRQRPYEANGSNGKENERRNGSLDKIIV